MLLFRRKIYCVPRRTLFGLASWTSGFWNLVPLEGDTFEYTTRIIAAVRQALFTCSWCLRLEHGICKFLSFGEGGRWIWNSGADLVLWKPFGSTILGWIQVFSNLPSFTAMFIFVRCQANMHYAQLLLWHTHKRGGPTAKWTYSVHTCIMNTRFPSYLPSCLLHWW